MSARRRMWMCLVAVAMMAVAPGFAAAQGWSYKDAAKPYAGRSITILDEVTPLQENMRTLVPEFDTDESGSFTRFAIRQTAPEQWPTLR